MNWSDSGLDGINLDHRAIVGIRWRAGHFLNRLLV